MKKDIGAAALVTPMPVCIVAAYDADGKPNAISFDTFHFGYYALGEKVAQAWDAGKALV